MSVFIDVENVELVVGTPAGTGYTESGQMAIGQGSKVFRADQSGIWLGAEKFVNADFSVDMEGNVVAKSADFSAAGYTKINIFKQNGIPTSISIGDIWFDTDDNNKIYRSAAVGADAITAGEWEAVQDGDIAVAQATADGKNVTYYQNTQPASGVEGDLWVDTGYEDSNTKLLLHLDGADSAVVATDFATGKAVTFVGGAILDTAQAKFGTASLFCDTDGDRLTLVDSADWYLGTGDFTIDCQLMFKNPVSAGAIASQYVDADNKWYFYYTGTNLRFYVEVANVATIDISRAWTPVHSTWYHIALTREGNDFKLWVDGVQLGATLTDADEVPDLASVLYIGALYTSTTARLDGWIDEFRWAKGVAKYTTAFSPPTAPYGLENESNRLYRYNGTNWVIVRDTSITDAILKSGVDQVLSGDVILNDRNVKIDGANARILISDGTDDRILIGYQNGGF